MILLNGKIQRKQVSHLSLLVSELSPLGPPRDSLDTSCSPQSLALARALPFSRTFCSLHFACLQIFSRSQCCYPLLNKPPWFILTPSNLVLVPTTLNFYFYLKGRRTQRHSHRKIFHS